MHWSLGSPEPLTSFILQKYIVDRRKDFMRLGHWSTPSFEVTDTGKFKTYAMRPQGSEKHQPISKSVFCQKYSLGIPLKILFNRKISFWISLETWFGYFPETAEPSHFHPIFKPPWGIENFIDISNHRKSTSKAFDDIVKDTIEHMNSVVVFSIFFSWVTSISWEVIWQTNVSAFIQMFDINTDSKVLKYCSMPLRSALHPTVNSVASLNSDINSNTT